MNFVLLLWPCCQSHQWRLVHPQILQDLGNHTVFLFALVLNAELGWSHWFSSSQTKAVIRSWDFQRRLDLYNQWKRFRNKCRINQIYQEIHKIPGLICLIWIEKRVFIQKSESPRFLVIFVKIFSFFSFKETTFPF